jgi:Fe-S oxidoreductase
MSDRVSDFIVDLDQRVAAIAEACTACGACAEVCPTLDEAGIEAGDPQALTAGVRNILAGTTAPEASRTWAQKCCSSGKCLTVCEHGINPRFMLTMARRALSQATPSDDRRTTGKSAFQKMSKGVRMLSRLTMSPDQLARLNPPARNKPDHTPDVVFYTGCNMLKTPHIGLLCLDVLDRIGVTYDVQGGPGACCGILQLRPGDTENSARQALNTLDKMAASKTSKVLSWCPTCQIQFGETMIPSYTKATGADLDMSMFPVYLASRLDDLRPHMTTPVNKRVAIYEYQGALGVMEAVRALLGAIPGLEIVEVETSSIGYNNSSLVPLGNYHRDRIAKVLSDAEAAGIDTLVGVYHADHREFSGHEAVRPFTIANYMELLGESMGIVVADRFKELKMMQDANAIIAASKERIREHGLDPDAMRDAVVSDMLGDQILPLTAKE